MEGNARASSEERRRSPTLIAAIQKALVTQSQAKLASRAGASTRAIADIRKGWTPADLTARKRVGLAESLTRLALCVGVDPETVLKEIEIWDDEVVQAKSRATAGRAEAPTDGEVYRISHLLMDPLTRELRSRAQTDLAEDIGVSTKTLAEVLKGWPERLTGRKRVGLAESLTRIALYFRIEPRRVLQEVGIWDDPGVQAKSRATARREVVSTSGQGVAAEGDQALTDISVRGAVKGTAGIVKVGILAWEPFHTRGAGSTSFAGRYARSLLGAVNPEWIVETTEYTSLQASLEALTGGDTGGGAGAVAPHEHLVFGLYDLVSREARGVDFVAAPGLSIRAGGLWLGEKLDWLSVLSPAEKHPFAVVVRAEAGYLTLAGACRYPAESLQILDSVDPDEIVTSLVKAATEKWEAAKIPVCLIADAYTVHRAYECLERLPSFKDKVKCELMEESDYEQWAPSYAVGLGVSAASPRFREHLRRATEVDLFGTSVLNTARIYLDLLWPLTETDKRVHLRRSSVSDLGPWQLERFRDALGHVHRGGRQALVERRVFERLFADVETRD